jgi:hypothetical protein
MPKKVQITQERVEYNVFLFDEPPKGSISLKTFKISLTFRFDKLSNLSKSVHTGENSEILTVSNKKILFYRFVKHLCEVVQSAMPYLVIIAGIVNISLFFFILNVIEALGNYQLIFVFILEYFHHEPDFHYSYNFVLD